jgi:hypothetical protein
MASIFRANQGDRRTLSAAVQRNLARLLAREEEWVRRAPASADARAALARAEELTGGDAPREGADPLAFTTLLEARRLSRDPRQQLELASMQVRLLVKYSLFARARALAESLLIAIPHADSGQAVHLAAIAALTGREDRTANLLRARARVQPGDVFPSPTPIPPAVVDPASAFLAAGALGTCDATVRSYPATLRALVNQYVPSDQRDEVFNAVALRALTLAVPCLGADAVVGMRGSNLLLRLEQTFARKDSAALVAQVERSRALRVGARPGDLALDHLYHESRLLVQVGHEVEAGRNLDELLTALPTLSPMFLNLDHVPAAASLGRSLALAAQLAVARADTTLGACYARAVVELWAGASPGLQPVVSQMRAVSGLRPRDVSNRCRVAESSPQAMRARAGDASLVTSQPVGSLTVPRLPPASRPHRSGEAGR